MKKHLFWLLLWFVACNTGDRHWREELLVHRAEVDHWFRTDPRSPLPPEIRPRFRGLSYFPPAPRYRFPVHLEPVVPPRPTTIAASGGEDRRYFVVGTVSFTLEGRDLRLEVLGDSLGKHLFIPFTDLTSGRSTYSGGRYLNLEAAPDGTVELDFNRAYNPYCAYNHRYSCALPPPENDLPVAVRAGEKNFPLH